MFLFHSWDSHLSGQWTQKPNLLESGKFNSPYWQSSLDNVTLECTYLRIKRKHHFKVFFSSSWRRQNIDYLLPAFGIYDMKIQMLVIGRWDLDQLNCLNLLWHLRTVWKWYTNTLPLFVIFHSKLIWVVQICRKIPFCNKKPSRRISSGACQKYRIGSEPVNERYLNLLQKGQKIVPWGQKG